jgi:hypothetical protein
MFTVDSIWDDGKKILGTCDDEKFLRYVGDSAALVGNKEDLEGLKGWADICTVGCSCQSGLNCSNAAGCGRRCISMPREVLTVIGVNVGGQPLLGRSQLFQFHLNGTGSCRTVCEWSYDDRGYGWPTQRDLVHPSKLVAYVASTADNGVPLIVFGYDIQGNLLRRQENGVWLNGYRVPTIYGIAVPDAEAPVVARITSVQKGRSVGQVRLSTIDDGGAGSPGLLLGVYEPDETLPQYRRIQLNRSCSWVRIAYIKAFTEFHSRWDHIPLTSRLAFLLALQARKFYGEQQIAQGQQYEANAARIELEAQMKLEPPTFMPPQVLDWNQLRDKFDYDIR